MSDLRKAANDFLHEFDEGIFDDDLIRAVNALRARLAAPRPEPVAKAWAEGYQQGVQDERTSGASIGIAGFGAKVEPARQNPYGTAPPAAAPEPVLMELARQMKPLDADIAAILYANLDSLYIEDEPAAAPEKRHPGYVIGNHWLETAYSRICAGEAEADVLKDCGWERVTDAEALRLNDARYHKLKTWLYRQCLLSIERCRIDTPESLGDWWILRKPKVIEAGAVGYGKTEDAAIDAAMENKT